MLWLWNFKRKDGKIETDWLTVIALIIVAFGIQYNRNDIDELKRQINKLKQGKDKAIEPGEPCDLCLKSLVTSYHKLGRDRIIELVKQGKTEKEIKQIAKEKKK